MEDDVDLRLKLLGGDSLFTKNVEITPITLRDIKDVGYSNYAKYLSILTLDKDTLVDDPKAKAMSLIEIIAQSGVAELIDAFSDALCYFLKEKKEDLLVTSRSFVFGGYKEENPEDCRVIDSNNYLDFISILKYQNCITSPSEKLEAIPADDKARQILEKLKKGKEAVQSSKRKASSGSDIDFADIISSVSTKSNTYNKSTIWDMTVYQLYDEYKRLEAISGYEISIKAMMAGAKIEDLKHWSSKIDD